jgi:hypothetical protein
MEKGYVVVKGSHSSNEADAIKNRPPEGDVEVLVHELKSHGLVTPSCIPGEYLSVINFLSTRKSEVLAFVRNKGFDLYICVPLSKPPAGKIQRYSE